MTMMVVDKADKAAQILPFRPVARKESQLSQTFPLRDYRIQDIGANLPTFGLCDHNVLTDKVEHVWPIAKVKCIIYLEQRRPRKRHASESLPSS